MNEETAVNSSLDEKLELKVLIVEDSKIEAKFTVNLLKKNGYAVVHERVETEEDMRRAMDEHAWDIIISDYQMPDFDGMRALKLFLEYEVDIPFILVSGKIGEETAVDLMKMGANDYIMKGNTARLIPAIKSHLQDAAGRRERKRLEAALRESEAQYRGFFENAAIGIFRTTEQGALQDANKGLASTFGFQSVQEFMNTVGSLAPEIHDEHTRQAKTITLVEGIQTGGHFEAVFHKPDGSMIIANVNVWSIQENADKPVYLEGTIEDITERREMERKLREMEELHEGLIDITSNL
ncbi:MAG: response regulator [Verrucomicrobiota bacterium]